MSGRTVNKNERSVFSGGDCFTKVKDKKHYNAHSKDRQPDIALMFYSRITVGVLLSAITTA